MAVSSIRPSLASFFNQGNQTITVHALSAGTLTLPAVKFIHPCEPADLRLTKPSLSFLIQHTDSDGHRTKLLFDLGIRRILPEYPPQLQKHLLTRQPLSTSPDVSASLERGGLSPGDIDVVILSHVHWDHVGRPRDFGRSMFVVGNGALNLLQDGGGAAGSSHSHFEADLLPPDRTIELRNPSDVAEEVGENRAEPTTRTAPFQDPNLSDLHSNRISSLTQRLALASWKPLLDFPSAIDVFNDQSLFIVNAPGHLQGHINLLARTSLNTWIYLAGDACHDRTLLNGERDIAEWESETGARCCIHHERPEAERTLARIRKFEAMYSSEVEVVLAHDDGWIGVGTEKNEGRFWPGKM